MADVEELGFGKSTIFRNVKCHWPDKMVLFIQYLILKSLDRFLLYFLQLRILSVYLQVTVLKGPNHSLFFFFSQNYVEMLVWKKQC